MALSGTKALLVWSQRVTEGYKDVNVTNMQKSWKDGLAFCAVLHHFRPDLIDFDSLSKENVRENNKLAFDVAEEELGIPALLDPDDMATMHVPDKLSIMTYVSQYYSYFRDKKPIKDVGGQKTRTPSKRPAGESPLQHVPNKQPTLGDTCTICGKKVYLVERQVADGKLYHRNCFRCSKCKTSLRSGNYKATANPKQLECLDHGDNIWKLRSDIASRASKEKKQASNGGSIWEARPGMKAMTDSGGSLWQKQSDGKPPIRENDGVAGVWEARSGLKPVPKNTSTAGGLWEKQSNAKSEPEKPALPPQKPQVADLPQPSNKPAVPMHPHLIASKAARERFNSPAATQEPKPVQQPSRPSLVSPEKNLSSDAAKTEATRQGLLASLAAVRGNLKPGTAASKDYLLDALEGGTGRKLAVGEEDSREASPAGSNWSLPSDAKEVSKSPSKDEETSMEVSKESEKASPETDEIKTESEPLSVGAHSRDSGHTSSDVFSLTSISSISQINNSETSSVDIDQQSFASGIEPGKRSSALSRDSISDQEGVTAANLNLSDSFCVEYNTTKAAEPANETGDLEGEPDASEIVIEKQDEKGVREEEKAESQTPKPKVDDYDESLNPFGDDDEEEEEVKESKDDGYKNPFDESGSEDDDAYDDNLNPFGDDDDEDPSLGSPIAQWPPLPVGGTGSSKPAEIPSQQGSYKVKTRQEILQEMQRDRHTLKSRQKRPAPPRPDDAPPRPTGAPPRPTAPPNRPGSSITQEKDSLRPPPRSRKSRPAPSPPKENGRPPEAADNKSRPDKPPPPAPASIDQRTNSDASAKPVPSPRLKKIITPGKELDGRISPVPSPRRQCSTGAKTNDESPVPSPRMRRGTDELLDRKQVKPPRPTSDPIKPPTLSTQGSRKRAPAPPPVKREVDKYHVDPAIIQKELCEIEIKQRELEAKGIKIEQSLRTHMEGHDQDNEDLLIEWFALVNEKNQLLRREGELVAQSQMQDLELQQAEIEYELRCLMHKHEHQKTDADVEREEKLLEMLVEAVTKRSRIVERLEEDRRREEAEDKEFQSMMEQSGFDKKNMEKKKQKVKKVVSLLGK
ncbi:MICAL-like protein 1 isoform X2 [Acanthaster planci]|uniref:MICAL-like protein 1 isoform X2 n=1 Tax=Acanthaster planci TaxID=133434 RepID=A0A8B7XIB2_ACAPL|nr:MICAL-like protein 1 isoform X2 [Acanthaster planci]